MKSLRCLAAALLATVAVSTALPAAAQAPLRKVNVGILYLAADNGIFIALEKGYFREEGLDVQLHRFTSAADAVALLATDRLEVGSGGSSPGLFNAYIRGAKAPIVTSKAILSIDDTTGSAILVRSDLVESGRVKEIKDLKGLKVVVNNIQSPSLNYVVRGLARGGLKREDVELMELPFDQFIPALQRKAVDVALAFSPLAQTIGERMKLGVPLQGAGPHITSTGDTANMMFYSENFAKSDAGRGFMVAHLKAMRDYQRAVFDGTGDKVEACSAINKHLPYIPKDCAGISMSFVDPDGTVNVESLERYQDEWVQWGLMREKANIRANVDLEPLNYAIGKLGKYRK